jgi:uncharacterized protein involved in exopolysaccharide biosynthesis
MQMTEDLFSEEQKEYFNLKKILLKCWKYRRPFLIILGVIGLLALALLIIMPKAYKVKASITILDEERGGSKNDIYSINKMFYSGRDWLNTENEVEVLHSTSLIEKVISNLDMYAEYKIGGMLKDHISAANSPVTVKMNPDSLEVMASTIMISLSPESNSAMKVDIETKFNEDNWEKSITVKQLPVNIATPYGPITLEGSIEKAKQMDKDLQILLLSPMEKAISLAEKLSVGLLSRTSSVVSLEFMSPDRQEGMDFLNELVKCYNQNANFDKNRIARRTQEFLDKRITDLSQALNVTDERLADYKRKAGLTDMDVDTKAFRSENSMYDKDLHDTETQLYLLKNLKDFLQNEDNRLKTVPSDIGLNDKNLSDNINQHNQLVLDYQRLSRSTFESNPVTANLYSQIQASYDGLLATIENSYSGMLIAKNEIERKTKQYNSLINRIPASQRALGEIMRQQENQQSLYLDLLKKQEENSLMIDALTENAHFIDLPYSSAKASWPNKKILLLATLILSMIATAIWIFLRELFSPKIISTDEIGSALKDKKVTGKILFNSKVDNVDMKPLATHLMLTMSNKRQQTVCIFSSQEGDGKTFLATRLANELANMGKKVLLLKFESDETSSNGNIQLDKLKITGSDNNNLSECVIADNISNLRQLVNNPKLAERLDQLCLDNDYVVIDSVSLEIMSDTLQLVKQANYGLYVCRLEHTQRKNLEELAAINDSSLLPDFNVVVNNYS